MSNLPTLFKNQSTDVASLLAGYNDDVTSAIAGRESSGRRISIRGGRFRQIVDGKEVNVSREDSLDVVIIAAAPIARAYYEDKYVEGEAMAPTCWSSDTNAPDASVPEANRMHAKCDDCPMNIKGSGEGDRRACRFSQRVAVKLDGEIEDGPVYQLQLPATSIFGGDKNAMSLQAYGRFLRAHNAHVISIVTKMTMDTDSTAPKLTFSAVRALEADELRAALEAKTSPETEQAIKFQVFQQDKTPAKLPKPSAPAQEAPAKEAEKQEAAPAEKRGRGRPKKSPFGETKDTAEVPEPVRRDAKPAPAPEVPVQNVSALLDEWDDE